MACLPASYFRAGSSSQPADQQFALVDHLWRKMTMQVDEKLFVADDLGLPRCTVHRLELVERFLRKVHAFPFHGRVVWSPTDRRFFGLCAATDTVDNPFKDPHVLAEAGP